MSAPAPLRGVHVPLVTPFTADDEVDTEAFRRQVKFMIDCGVDGLVVGGSTGEGYALSEAELLRLVEIALAASGGRLPVTASVMVDSTRAAVLRARSLATLPVAALQIAPPHYIFPPDAAGQASFFAAIGAAMPLPIIIYNVIPWNQIAPATVAEIMHRTPTVTAVKQSDTDLGAYAALVEAVGHGRVFAAIDAGLMSCYELGAAGSIAAICTAAPRASVRLWRAVQANDHATSHALHRGLVALWTTLSAPNLPARVKAALDLQGVSAGRPRAPMAPPSPTEVAAIGSALARLGKAREVAA